MYDRRIPSAAYNAMLATIFHPGLRRFILIVSAVLAGASCSTYGQLTNWSQVHSFGFPLPYDMLMTGLVRGGDNNFYGVSHRGGAANAGVVYRLSADGTAMSVLHDFGITAGDGREPYTEELAVGSDGALYGVTWKGGTHDAGTIFKLHPDGTGYQVLRSFGPLSSKYESIGPGTLLACRDGLLYGMTHYGGAENAGYLYRIDPTGSNFTILFQGSTNSGASRNFYGPLLELPDGALYGAAGPGPGSVFRIQKDGSSYSQVYAFGGYPNAGYPYNLTLGSDGKLYGVSGGGSTNLGTIFCMSTNGSNFAVLHHFGLTREAGFYAFAALTEASDGALYGVARDGGNFDLGVVYRIGHNGSGYQVVWHFGSSFENSTRPSGKLLEHTGVLYGVSYAGTPGMLNTIYKINKDGSGYVQLQAAHVTGGDGWRPDAALFSADDGFLFGSTMHGGIRNEGTLFKVRPDGSHYSIIESSTNSSASPAASATPLIQGTDGKLYGAAQGGGLHGYGVVFSMDQDGSQYVPLHNFGPDVFGTRGPSGALVESREGVLYAATWSGGTNRVGVIFKLNKDGSNYAEIFHFSRFTTGGYQPKAGLLEGGDNALYGVTSTGGPFGGGAIFKLNKDGGGHTVVAHFLGGLSGLGPAALPIEGPDGMLYGTTSRGGQHSKGCIYRVQKDGSDFTILHSFTGANGDGAVPQTSLVQGRDGTLYGATEEGGAFDFGTLFKIKPDGTGYTILKAFEINCQSVANLTYARDGALYIPARYGGVPQTFGVLFRFGHALSLTRASNHIALGITGIPGQRYVLERSQNLRDWTPMSTFLMPATASYGDFSNLPFAFYRLQIQTP